MDTPRGIDVRGPPPPKSPALLQPGDRFEEILDRHGQDSIVAQSRGQARPEMYGMVARTLRRASRAQPLPEALMITPVQLGCSTLVRVQGELTETSAGQAISSLLHVLDQAPHAVLIDLALLTGLDHAGAGAITVAARCSPDTPITLIDPRGRDRALLEGTRQPIAYGLEAALAPHCAP